MGLKFLFLNNEDDDDGDNDDDDDNWKLNVLLIVLYMLWRSLLCFAIRKKISNSTWMIVEE